MLGVGIGLDAGEAVPVGDGYRGRALNLAARLCARARGGEILVTSELVHLAGAVEGIRFEDRGPVRLKGLSRPVDVLAVTRGGGERHGALVRGRRRGPPRVPAARSARGHGRRSSGDVGRPSPAAGPRASAVGGQSRRHDGRADRAGLGRGAAARGPQHDPELHLAPPRRTGTGPDRGPDPRLRGPRRARRARRPPLRAVPRRARRLLPTDPREAATTLDEALSLWAGSPLSDLADSPSLDGEIARLQELRVSAIEDLIGARLSVGEHAEVLPDLERLVREHPLRERLWAHLMLARYRSGRQAEALDAFRQAQELLADELGIDPSPELQELQRRILQQDPALQLTGQTAPRVPVARAGRGGRVRRRLARARPRARPRGRREADPPASVRRPQLRPTLRAGGADDRAPGASARRPALRLLARRERRVPRDAMDARRQPRGRPRALQARPGALGAGSSISSPARSRPRTEPTRSTAT